MKYVIIAGGRDYSDYDQFKLETSSYLVEKHHHKEIHIVSGGCDDKKKGVLTYTRKDGSEVFGADGMAERYAEEYGLPITVIKADWKKYGVAAGPIRNKEMAKIGTHLLAFNTGGRGTKSMIEISRVRGLQIDEIMVPPI